MLKIFRLPRGQADSQVVQRYWPDLYELQREQVIEWSGDDGALAPTVEAFRASYGPVPLGRGANNGVIWAPSGLRPSDLPADPELIPGEEEPQTIIGLVELDWSTEADLDLLETQIYVARPWRRRGIGSAALAWAIQQATEMGRGVLEVYAPARPAGGPGSLVAPAGGAIDPATPGTAFALARGFHLAHLESQASMGVLDEGGSASALEYLSAMAGPAQVMGYEMVSWTGQPPGELLAEVAQMLTGFQRDLPGPDGSHGEKFDGRKVSAHFQSFIDRGWLPYVTAAKDRVGRLVGYTMAQVREGSSTAMQLDTWVHPDHRGQRLSLAMKIANITALLSRPYPPARLLTYMAKENRSMWAINRKLGFHPTAAVACWRTAIGRQRAGIGGGEGHT